MKPLSRLALVVVPLAGCSSSEDESAAAPTYHRDIAPLVQEHCVSCHQPGAIAPWSLQSYQDVRSVGALAKAATAERRMPPFGVDASGDCRTYRDARYLSDEEIALFGRWVDAGMPEGDAATATALEPPPLESLAGETVAASMAEAYEPLAGGADEYRCFQVPVDLDRDVFVTGYEVVPGNAAIVHHVVVWSYDPAAPQFGGGTNAEVVASLDGADGKPGWDCLGLAGGVFTKGMPALWTPGTGVTRFPEGTGLPLAQGDALMFEVHYSLAAGSGPDLTRVELEVADQVDRPAELVLVDAFIDTLFAGDPHLLPPGMESVAFSWEGDLSYMTTPPGGPGAAEPLSHADIYGVFPHMHTAGSSLSAELVRGTTSSCAAEVPRWDFNWQQVFFYDEPLRMEAGDVMRVTCEWDTRGRSEPTLPGFATSDEMCTFGVFVVPGR